MKKTIVLWVMIILFTPKIFPQSSKTIFNQLGVSVSYSYQSIGNVTNEATGTKFTKYAFTGTITNSSNKYFDVRSSISYETMQVQQLVNNESDKTFIRNHSIDASLDPVFDGQKCNNYPNDGVAHLFVICPGGSSIIEKTFIYPQNAEGSPPITYNGVNIIEVKGEAEEQKQQTATSSTQPAQFSAWKTTTCYPNLKYRVKTVELFNLNYQVHMYFEVQSSYSQPITFVFELLNKNGQKEFGDGHTVNPGGMVDFVHKMSSKNITGIKISNAKFSNGKEVPCNGNGEDQTNNSSNNPPSNSTSSNFQSILEEHNRLCNELQPLVTTSSPSSAYVQFCQNPTKTQWEETEGNKRNLQSQNTQLANEIKRLGGAKIQQETAQKAEEEHLTAQSKIWQQKTVNFTNLMQEGESQLGNANYDAAISKFNEAKNLYTSNVAPQEQQYASSAIAQADAAIARAQKAKVDAARKVRLENQKKADTKEDEVYGTASTAAIGLMALLTDEYKHGWGYFKLQAGLGAESVPMIANVAKTSKSEIVTSMHPTIHLGCKIGLFNNKAISLHLNPFVSYGINALSNGISGVHVLTGGFATLYLSPKATSAIKLFAEGGYLSRTGEYTYDADAVTGGNSATDIVKKAEYNYTALRYGGGIMLHFINKEDLKETFIKPSVFLEKISFASPNAKPVMGFNLQININSFIIIDATYSKNYVIAGKNDYPFAFQPENRDFWGIKLIRQGVF